ncbi:MAG: preprotein translocase subunit SecG [Acidobacteria bacterium]|nr:preprotein translocase subunit SecG [Acidobacteriota bacterium]
MLYYLLVTIYVLVCFILIGVILLQQGKGGDIANAFGGGGGSQAVFGARSGATLLTRATSVLAVLFIVLSLVLTAIGQRGGSSVVGGIDAPAPVPASALPAPAPATPAPATPAPATPPADTPVTPVTPPKQ